MADNPGYFLELLDCLRIIDIRRYEAYKSVLITKTKTNSTRFRFNLYLALTSVNDYIYHTLPYSGTNTHYQDQTTSRTNTLLDDADDIQRQLDNEARDRFKFGRVDGYFSQPKTVWVFHIPTHIPTHNIILNADFTLDRQLRDIHHRVSRQYEYYLKPPITVAYKIEWDYGFQHEWFKTYPDCGGRSQSPVDLPISGLTKARGARSIFFQNFESTPRKLTLMNDGKRVILFGEWPADKRPLVYGGAAHSRRYLFHSLSLHWPSEHTVGGLQYPLESQVLFVSAEYKDMDQALEASSGDPQAFLAIASLYKYGNFNHRGIEEILDYAKTMGYKNGTVSPKPINHFSPPFKEYACYQGSLTFPPCTEAVLWLIRGRTLSITRETADFAHSLLRVDTEPRHLYFRNPQPLNDRKVFLFK